MGKQGKRAVISGIAMGAAAGAAAFLLARGRQQRRALAQQGETLDQQAIQDLGTAAEAAFLPGDGVQLHTVLAGPQDGPLAVLLHGFPECWYSWRRQIPALVDAGYRVAVPDQRGYNLSDKPAGVQAYQIDRLTADVTSLMQALGRSQATIVGHDWGGLVAWRLAMDQPAAVDKLVVLNAPHPVSFAKALRQDRAQRRRSWYIFLFQMPWLPEALLSLAPRTTARLLLRGTAVRREAFSDADLEVMAAALAQPGAAQAMIHWYRAAFRYRPAKKASTIETPTLLIWGEEDMALGKPLTYGLARWVPGLRLHYVAHCGHWVQNEAPDEVNGEILSFLGRRA
jgi:pimeloyl-ACP methyl ester carboxylesterase